MLILKKYIQHKYYLSLSLSVLLALSCNLSVASTEIIKGMNYDPIHSLEYAKGMGLDNLDLMKAGIFLDLDRLVKFRNDNTQKSLTHIKTFYTIYSSAGVNPARAKISFNIADVIDEWNAKQLPENKITLALGVYEFQPDRDGCGTECEAWTQEQVKAAVKAANQYGHTLVDRIIVGSEDMHLNQQIRDRIAHDAQTIKSQLKDSTTTVGTAQISVFVHDMLDPTSPNYNQYQVIKNAVDFIGTNVYPFWYMGSSTGTRYGDDLQNSPVKDAILNYWDSLTKLYSGKELIITEEGWPSAGDNNGASKPDPVLEHDYFYYWYSRWMEGPVSYYFALYDRFPGQSMESHWGILAADRTYSITEGDYSKPLDINKGHIIVNFNNQIGTKDEQPKARTASLYACTVDWSADIQWQDVCYPIYGAPSIYLGDIAPSSAKQIMVDKSGDIYKSILVSFYNDNKQPTVLCHINSISLSRFYNQENLTLGKINSDGSCDLTEN